MDIVSLYNKSFELLEQNDPCQTYEEALRLSQGFFQWVCEMKLKFLPDPLWENIRVLEIGAGVGGLSLHLARLGAKCTVLDFSTKALSLAKKNADLHAVSFDYVCQDVAIPQENLKTGYDIIIDSHVFHCLALEPERINYLQFVKDHLSPQGFFIGESMVLKKKMMIPSGYRLDTEEEILYQKFNEWVPVRKIIDSLNLEIEFQKSGLNILYFMYYAHFVFQPSRDFTEIPEDLLPASVRFVVRKPD